jgi:tetratricopeptide (TPR) repeat protein
MIESNDPFAPPVAREDIQPRSGHTFDPAEPIPEHLQPRGEPAPRKQKRDTDLAEQMFRFKTATWSFAGGGSLFGLGFGFRAALKYPDRPALTAIAGIAGFLFGGLITYFGVRLFSERAGGGAASLYFPGGGTTPGDRQYSLAQSYVARGLYDRAAIEYEKNANMYPQDAEPCMRLARLMRDELQRYDDAIGWFKRAASIPGVSPGTEMMALREMIEVYTHRLRNPSAAAPHMARLAARHPNTAAGDWAKRELAQMKAQMREESTDA